MSRADFFCFVEGVDNDRYVYSQITSQNFMNKNLVAEYPTANSLTSAGGHGGKDVLINFFNFLSEANSLISDFKGKKTTIIFFLDKDVDDLLGAKVRSKYVLYTEHYDVQNYLFLHGDVINAGAATASIPVDSLSQTLGQQSTWMDSCAISWKEWVTVCLFLKVCGISLAGYRVSSQVNTNEYGPLDQSLLDNYRGLAFRKSGLDRATFAARYGEIEAAVEEMYASGNASRIFKGKWFLHWLVSHLASKHQATVAPKSLACTLSSNLEWRGKWTRPYKAKVNRLIKEHLN